MLKKYASIIRFIGIAVPVLTLIGGIYIAVKLESFWYFLGCAVVAALSCIYSLAFAELLDTTGDNTLRLAKLGKAPSASPAPAAGAAITPIQPIQEAPVTPVPTPIAVVPCSDADGWIICPHCGERQRANRSVCFNCSTPFKKD